MSRAISMLSAAVSVGSRLYFWNTKPTVVLRSSVRSASRHREQIAAVDVNGAGGRRREAAQNVKQRRLAGAAGADDRHETRRARPTVHAAQRVHVDLADVIGLREIANLNHRLKMRSQSYASASIASCRAALKPGIKRADQRTVSAISAAHGHQVLTITMGMVGTKVFISERVP